MHTPSVMIKIRVAQLNDVDKVASVHIAAFQGFFLTQLGKKFLVELYNGFLNEKSGIFLIAENQNEIVGFAAGCIRPEDFFRDLRNKRWLQFFCAAIPMMLKQPVFVLQKLIDAFFYKGENPSQLADSVLLSSIAVAPSFSGTGIGRMLVAEFCDQARKLGGKTVYVITDKNDNDSVNGFYRKSGFFVESTFVKTGKRQMNRLVKELHPSDGTGKEI